MRLLHTSDWHVGRTFHGADTVDALSTVLGEIPGIVRRERIDAVLVAGDVFDSAMPAGRHVEALTRALQAISDAGAQVILSSGNHDSPARLGANAGFARAGGLHLSTAATEPGSWRIDLEDEHGPVAVFAIPYLEPVVLRAVLPEAGIGTQADAMRWAMDAVRADLAERPARSVVLAHCFAAGVAADDDDAPREIRAGGLDVVPLAAFDGVDYAALGHIHSRQQLSTAVRYSGAPLHYSFRERSPERGGWLVELGAEGLAAVEWLGLSVPRALTQVRGELEALLADPVLDGTEDHWVRAVLTDAAMPLDAMRRLQQRWPHCAQVEWAGSAGRDGAEVRERLHRRSDAEVVDDFLAHVRGEGPSDAERALVAEGLARVAAEGAAR
ncbi:MAG: exonuclease SbcCD subunit D [Actinomycetota bacterium]